MKKRDILLAGGIVLVALVMLLVMHVTGETKGDQVQITVNGEIYGTYPLEKDQTIEVTEGEISQCDPHRGRTGIYGRSGLPGRLLQGAGQDQRSETDHRMSAP